MNNALNFSALILAAILVTGCSSVSSASNSGEALIDQKARQTGELVAPAFSVMPVNILHNWFLTTENPKKLQLMFFAVPVSVLQGLALTVEPMAGCAKPSYCSAYNKKWKLMKAVLKAREVDAEKAYLRAISAIFSPNEKAYLRAISAIDSFSPNNRGGYGLDNKTARVAAQIKALQNSKKKQHALGDIANYDRQYYDDLLAIYHAIGLRLGISEL